MFANSTLFGIMEDGTIKKFLMEDSIEKLRKHFADLYQLYNSYEKSEYIYGYKNDHDQLSYVDFTMDDEILGAISDASSIETGSVVNGEWLQFKSIFMGEQNTQNCIVFQRIQKSQIISKGIRLISSRDTLAVFDKDILSIPSRIECYFTNDKLFFNSIWHARQVFDMSQYIREATDDDVEEFATCELFTDCDSDELVGIADQQIRSRITVIQASGVLQQYSAKKIQSVANKIGFPLKTKQDEGKGKIVMPEGKKDLKTFLKMLDETIYEGMLSGELKESNSSKPFKI